MAKRNNYSAGKRQKDMKKKEKREQKDEKKRLKKEAATKDGQDESVEGGNSELLTEDSAPKDE